MGSQTGLDRLARVALVTAAVTGFCGTQASAQIFMRPGPGAGQGNQQTPPVTSQPGSGITVSAHPVIQQGAGSASTPVSGTIVPSPGPVFPVRQSPPAGGGNTWTPRPGPVFGGNSQASPNTGITLQSHPVFQQPADRGTNKIYSQSEWNGGRRRQSPSDGNNQIVTGQPYATNVLHGTIGPTYTVTTPEGRRHRHRHDFDDFVYSGNGGTTVITTGPAFLGGYYYSSYCSSPFGVYSYPSVFSNYYGFPGYIYNPSLVVLSDPYYPTYNTPYTPFNAPTYQVTYNQTNYYASNDHVADDIQDGGPVAQKAIKQAYAEDSYQAAFADIERAWDNGDPSLLSKHLRDSDTKIAVSLKGKYRYSIASGDFEQISKDAFDRLQTVSFKFTELRKAKNGDITAYGTHTYKASGDENASDSHGDDSVVPFDTDSPDQSSKADTTADKKVYVSYTLRKHDDVWYIIGVDSSPKPLVSAQEDDAQS